MPRFLAVHSESNAPLSKREAEMKRKQKAIHGQERESDESQQSPDSCPYPTPKDKGGTAGHAACWKGLLFCDLISMSFLGQFLGFLKP